VKYILSRTSLAMLAQLTAEKTLCGFDFDGTLSPIVDHPDGATMRPRTRELLRLVSSLYPCIVISGRSRADVAGKLEGVPLAAMIGNHGAETESTRQSGRLVEQWSAALEPKLASASGVWIEDKGHSLAIHYRHSAQRAKARRRILAATRGLENARIFGGRLVINLSPIDAPNKGDALAAERDRLGCTWVLYVGDDENDEDAFALDGNVVSIRIGPKLKSKAAYYLRDQTEIDDLLETLLRLGENLPAQRI
jgi:trehalose 6-phosphate phosphatase